ncbi:hypothetical protein BTVI_95674 [Pitangus sulphuratus]|nr:hypothetical protein BTVI_95674 [Pitangus sulphuratus]
MAGSRNQAGRLEYPDECQREAELSPLPAARAEAACWSGQSYGNHCTAYAPVCLIDCSLLLLFCARGDLTFDEVEVQSGLREIFRGLCYTLVGPHLESCEQLWDPQFKKQVKVLECDQRRATKLVKGLKGKSHEQQLRTLVLSSLEKGREGVVLLLSMVSLGGDMERDVLNSSPWDPVTIVGMAQRCATQTGICLAVEQLCEKDLGILVDSKLHKSEQGDALAKEANGTLGCINKGIISRGKEVITLFYSALFKPYLEYCLQF